MKKIMEKYMTLVINQSDAFFNSVEQIGGKAKNLSNLHYYNIPSWVVLPTNSFDYFLKENQIQDQFIEILNSINSESDTTDLSNKLKSLIEEAKIPKILLNEINKFIKEDQFYSVRS